VTFADLLTSDRRFAVVGRQERSGLLVPAVVVVRDDVEDFVGGVRPEVGVDVTPEHLSPAGGRHVGHVINRMSGDVAVSLQAGEAY